MNKCLKLFLSILFSIGFVFFAQPVAAHEGHDHSLPDGFKKTQLTDSLNQPLGIAQAADGRIFIIEKAGVVKIYKNGALLPSPALNISSRVDSDYERGLLGIAFDPNDSSSVYLYYVSNSPLEIRISRFGMSGDTINASSETILLKSTQTLSFWHHSGTIRFGPDGKIWASVGNNNSNDNSQDLTNIHGKILRINKDGSVPTDNPFYNHPGANKAIYAYGFRNPFRFNFMGSQPIVGDVGQDTFEEINVVSAGANYGWPGAEGACTGCSSANPFYSYPHPNGGSSSITGGFVYKSPSTSSGSATGAFPASYNNSYFYGDYAQGFIKRLTYDSGSVLTNEDFDTSAGAVVDMLQGNDGTLYFVNIYPSALFQIQFTTENLAPTAKITATPDAGLAPLSVQFSSEESVDPEGKPLTYSWNFGDPSAGSGQVTSTEANPTHVYTQNGTYTAALTVSDGALSASTISFPIRVGVTPPTATITSPVNNSMYNAGDLISYSATATDSAQGNLPESAYDWDIVFHHGTHVHPFQQIAGKKAGTFLIPKTGEPSADTYYSLTLTVTNNQGIKNTITHLIKPNKVQISFVASSSAAMDPALQNQTITIDGSPWMMPTTIVAVKGFQFNVDVPTPQILDGNRYDFVSWSDGGDKAHTISAQNNTYTINFKKAGTGKGDIYFRVRDFDKDGKFTGKFINGATAKLTDPTGATVYETALSAKDSKGEDGWVKFKGIQTGLYGLMVYKTDMEGYWLQTDCSAGGTTTGATIKNTNSTNLIAGFQKNVESFENDITWCKDIGLKPATGNIYFKTWLMGVDSQTTLGYGRIKDLNGVTVKLTDTTGTTVYKTVTSETSSWGTDGWAFIKDVKPGTYGLMAYKAGYKGFWKQTNCEGTQAINSSITNANTEGREAAWNNTIVSTGGTIAYCYDLGLLSEKDAKVEMRVREFDTNGNPTGKFLNGVTVKLLDPIGETTYQTTTTATSNGQDGWARFSVVPTGRYSLVAYKTSMSGYWKQTDCGTTGTTTGATLQNSATTGLLAGFQTDVLAIGGDTTDCKDIGLKNSAAVSTGKIHLRIREFDTNGNPTGKFLNGVTTKLTDAAGTTVQQTETSAVDDGQDGWVHFNGVPVGSYSIMAYKTSLSGYWKQTDCAGPGTHVDATIQNTNTEGSVAGFTTNVPATANQISYCHDIGLKNATAVAQPGSLKFRVREFDSQNNPTGKFINGATVKLLDQSMSFAYQTATSSAVGSDARLPAPDGAADGGQDGWVRFDQNPGTYTVLVFKDGMEGVWRQTDCGTGGTTENALMKNTYTEDKVAAMQQGIEIKSDAITFCKDVALKNPTVTPQTGNIHFRTGIQDTGFANGVIIKVLDGQNTVVAQGVSAAKEDQAGWVEMDVPAGTYRVVAYKAGFKAWKKQIDCGSGTADDSGINNEQTEGNMAGFQEVTVAANQGVWCKDITLQAN